MDLMNRRSLLGGGLVIATAALLGGCASKPRFQPMSKEGWDTKPGTKPPRSDQSGPVAGVIPRRQWTSSGPIMALANPMNGVSRITVHHSAIESGRIRSKADAARMLVNIRGGHLAQNWADIGYHYIVDPAGRVWEGRPVTLQGAHVKNQNEHNLGIMVMGNFETEKPSAEALQALDGFLAQQLRRYGVPISRVYTHREIGPTACPGRSLQAYMMQTRSRSGRLALS